MSRKIRPSQYADVKGIIVESFIPNLGLVAAGTTVPTDGGSGYSAGCLFFDLDAAAGLQLFINEGSTTSCDFNPVLSQTLTTGAGAGITGGTGTIYKNSVRISGGIYYTTILIDLTGLASSTTDLDIIGVGTSAAHLGQITAAQNGTILGGTITCLEVPAGGIDDIDLYYATEATGVFDGAIGSLTEVALVTNGGAWTLALVKAFADFAASANKYLYLTGGAGGTAATYTAGKFLIEMFGY